MIITIANRRGGVGKTITAHALGAGLKARGKSILFIDLDSQCNLSYDTGSTTTGVTVFDVLTRRADIKDAIQHTESGDILSGSPRLASADLILTETGKEYRLREQLEQVKNNYDYCIIDTPPALGILTVNALTASDKVIIPVQAEIHSINGVALIGETIETVKRYTNKDLQVEGILITRYNARSILARDMADNLSEQAKNLHTKVFDTKIRECVSLKESQAVQRNIFSYAPRSNGAKDYNAVIEEILRG